MRNKLFIFSALLSVLFSACEPKEPTKGENLASGQGVFVLNEGSWGSNNASLDFRNSETGVFSINIFSRINPDIAGGLGDIGNDLQIYGGKIYAVINYSNYVEVMDLNARHIGGIKVKNCRYIAFCNGKAYVSSYGDAIYSDGAHNGFVEEIDTAALQILRRVEVGLQPEEIAFADGKMYVANSGGYTAEMDNTVSVATIDMQSFTEIKKIPVALNLLNLRNGGNGKLYALGRGNYVDIQPDIYEINLENENVEKLNIPASTFCINGSLMYILSNTGYTAEGNEAKYILYNIENRQVTTENFITDGTEREIRFPYGINVNPCTQEIFITDAPTFTTSGKVFCFSSDGTKLWQQTTGVSPKITAFKN
jgi:DNA-binding beta-propeller fold protein YncE